jgi:hypothetical protein
MSRVLISGAQPLIGRVEADLRDKGAQVTAVVNPADLPAVCRDAGPGAFASYAMLPLNFQASGETAVRRLHNFYAEGVLARFTALDAVGPALAEDALVTFVLGQLPRATAAVDDRAARRALMGVLTRAFCADRPGIRVTFRMLDSDTTAADIAFVALGGDLAKQELLERIADLDNTDWRVELLGMAALET